MKKIKLFAILPLSLFLLMGCGKPTDPESLKPGDGGYKIVSRFNTAGYSQDVVKKDYLCYLAQGEGGLMIVDVADPKNPETVSITTEDVRGYSNKIAIKDSVVYLAAGTYGVTVVNAADPNQPVVTVSNLSIKTSRNFHIMGNFLFTAISEQGVSIADISYPTYPEIKRGIETMGYARGITTVDTTYLMVACGEMGLSMFDISNFQQGFGNYPFVGWCDTPGYAEAVAVLESESLAYVACGTAGLQIIDFSDTTNIHIVGSCDGGGYAKELLYDDRRIYMTVEKSGLQIIDVADIADPKLIGSVDTEYALGLDMDKKYIYVADEVEGLIIVSMPGL